MIEKLLQRSHLILFTLSCMAYTCQNNQNLSERDKADIHKQIKMSIDKGVEATRTKNIDVYMENLPEDLVIHDEKGNLITREQQKQYALRDWSIIDTTLAIEVNIDSVYYHAKDSIDVYTSQRWERMMFRPDGVTLDTVLTTQRHKELWKKTAQGWFNYVTEELGGQIFINGQPYHQ